jgi:hypothetical protein
MATIFLSINLHELAAEADALKAVLAHEHAFVLSDRHQDPSVPLSDRLTAFMGECDVFVGVYGAKSQPLPSDPESCFEEIEFNQSSLLSKPRLIYVRDAEKTDFRMSRFRRKLSISVPYHAYSDVLNLVSRVKMDLAGVLELHATSSDSQVTEPSLIKVIFDRRIPIPEYYPEYLKALIKFIRIFQSLPIVLAFVLAVFAALFYFLHTPLEHLRDIVGGRIVILFGGDPPEMKEVPLMLQKDAEKIASLQSDAWQKGREWKSAPNGTVVTGPDPGALSIGTKFSSLYGFSEHFTVTIPNPENQRSIAWIVRMQSSAEGASYYLITVTLPPVRDACTGDDPLPDGTLTGQVVLNGSNPKEFDHVAVEGLCLAKGVPRTLSIQTIATGAQFQVDVFIQPLKNQPPSRARGEHPYISRPLVDFSSTLNWGNVGFIGPEQGHGTETIGGFLLVPALAKIPSPNGSEKGSPE